MLLYLWLLGCWCWWVVACCCCWYGLLHVVVAVVVVVVLVVVVVATYAPAPWVLLAYILKYSVQATRFGHVTYLDIPI